MKTVNQRVFIYCEGLTEYYYAKALQMTLPRQIQRRFHIDYNYDLNNEPASMLKKAIKLVKEARRNRAPYEFQHINKTLIPMWTS